MAQLKITRYNCSVKVSIRANLYVIPSIWHTAKDSIYWPSEGQTLYQTSAVLVKYLKKAMSTK